MTTNRKGASAGGPDEGPAEASEAVARDGRSASGRSGAGLGPAAGSAEDARDAGAAAGRLGAGAAPDERGGGPASPPAPGAAGGVEADTGLAAAADRSGPGARATPPSRYTLRPVVRPLAGSPRQAGISGRAAVRAENEDDDGYDPYSDYHDGTAGAASFEPDPWR